MGREIRYLVYVLVMLSSVGCMQLLCSETFKCHFKCIAFTTKHLSQEKVLNILNDSDECALSDSSENDSSDDNGRVITAEEVHATWKEETTVYSLQREIRLCFEVKFFFLWLQKLYVGRTASHEQQFFVK